MDLCASTWYVTVKCAGGKSVTAEQGINLWLPLIEVGQVVVTVDPAKTAKFAAEARVIVAGLAACAPVARPRITKTAEAQRMM